MAARHGSWSLRLASDGSDKNRGMRSDLVENASGGKNAGQAGAGMGSGADKIEVAHVLADVVGAEPCALRENRFEGEAGAAIGVELILKIERGRDARSDQSLGQAGKDRRFQSPRNRSAIGLGLDPPVLSPLEVWHGRENIERVAALRRERGVGRGRAMQVEAEVGRQAFRNENVAQEFAVPGTKQDRMVPDVFVPAVRSEVPDE